MNLTYLKFSACARSIIMLICIIQYSDLLHVFYKRLPSKVRHPFGVNRFLIVCVYEKPTWLIQHVYDMTLIQGWENG
jgi:hypothetical protein